jgi:PAS domain S-box-containing protein
MLFRIEISYAIPFLMATMVIILAGLIWPRYKSSGVFPFTLFLLSTGAWIIIRTLDIAAVEESTKIFLGKYLYLTMTALAIFWFLFALDYTGNRGWKRARYIILLLLIPGFNLGVVLTRQWHNWDWLLIQPGSVGTLVTWDFGFMFILQAAYIIGLWFAGMLILWRYIILNPGAGRLKMAIILIGTVIPVLAHAILVSGYGADNMIDITPYALIVTAIIYTIAIYRFHIFDILPIAQATLAENIPDGILVLNKNNEIEDINQSATGIFTCDKQSVLKKHLAQISPELNQSITRQQSGHNFELNLDVNNQRLFYDVSLTIIRNVYNAIVGKLVILRDVTERKEMQEQLITQNRLASIGEFTSGVAHELNNPLSVVLMTSELLQESELPDHIANDLKIIHTETERAINVVNGLLTFIRKQPEEKQRVNINEILNNTLELLDQQLDDIQITRTLEPDLPDVMASEFQISQVFGNIILNAIYFLHEIEKDSQLIISTRRMKDIIRVSIKDNGPGIDPENITRLFQPFFTTKEVGKGTGLGLSICHGIITEHGGEIWAESHPGEGATFLIELPIYEDPYR